MIKIIETFIQKRKFSDLLSFYNSKRKKVKLHVGCGTNYFSNWINIDNNSDNNIEKLDINWDLTNPLPIPPESVDFIYNEHFLEHLSISEGQRTIQDFLRVLKPGGVLRIAMPDLEYCMKEYFNPKWKEAPYLSKFNLTFIKTKAEMINVNFRYWGHQWLYDAEELKRRLKEAGCKQVKICKIRKSQHKTLQNLETRDESTLIAEITK